MGFIDRLTSVFKQAPAPLQRVQGVGLRHQRPDYTSFQRRVNEGYKGNPVVAACVSVRANTLNEAPIMAYNNVTGEHLPYHPLTKLMTNPNPAMSQAEFWQTVSTYIDVGGNAYIVKARNALGGIQALYPYNDGQMIPAVNNDGIVDRYIYDIGDGHSRVFAAEDVIHIRSYYVDPLQPYLGMSPIVVSAIGIDAYNELMDTLYSTARNGGVVPGILSSQEFLPQPVIEQLKDQFQRKIGGRGEESGKPLVLSGGLSYSQIGQEISALQIPELFSQFEVEICGAFRVDPAVAMTRAGLLSSTYANKETAFREYTKLTRVPTWTSWGDIMTRGFSGEFQGVVLRFDTSNVEALKPDPAIREQLAIQMWQANAITKNELRTETRYGELEDGNVFSDAAIYPIIAEFNANLITMNEARELLNIPPIPDGDKYSYELVPAVGPMMLAEARGEVKAEFDAPADDLPPLNYYMQSEKEAAAYWQTADKIMQDYAEELAPFVADGMKTMYQQLTGQKAGKPDPTKIRIEELVRLYMTSTKQVRASLLNEIFYLSVQAAEGNPAEFQTILDKLTKQVGDLQASMLAESYGTARDEIGEVISKNVDLPEAELFAKLREKVTTLSEGRAQTIARTVTRASATTTQKSTWKEMNDDEPDEDEKIMRVWVTRRDGKVRPSHRKMDGLYVDVDGKFPEVDAEGNRTGKTLDGPAVGTAGVGNIANCRCVIRPVRKSKITRGYKPAGEG